MNAPGLLFQFLRRAWLELRFFGLAALQLDFEHPRVQRVVTEKLRMEGFDV